MNENEKSDLEKFRELINDIQSCILITRSLDGDLDGRPMSASAVDEDGTLWFFTNEYSKKIKEISWESKVCLTYVSSEKNSYAVVNGHASLSTDKEKMQQLWNPVLKAWFPEGLNDPNLSLMKVEPYRIELWEGNKNKAVAGLEILRAINNDITHDKGEHKKITL